MFAVRNSTITAIYISNQFLEVIRKLPERSNNACIIGTKTIRFAGELILAVDLYNISVKLSL